MTTIRKALFALVVTCPLLGACSAAPEHPTGTEDDALRAIGSGGLGNGGGGHNGQTSVTWPIPNLQYCSDVDPQCVAKLLPTARTWIEAGCAPLSLRVDFNDHPYNGPDGLVFATYVLCPSGVGVKDQWSYCDACLPEAPQGEAWVVTDEASGPCQSGCHTGTGTGTGTGGGVSGL